MVLTALTMLAGVGGLATRLGLTPDDVTLIVGALGFLATAARTFARRRARAAERSKMERLVGHRLAVRDIPQPRRGVHPSGPTAQGEAPPTEPKGGIGP
jgi:hypothetical protein